MKKYFNWAIAIEFLCFAYILIHNYVYVNGQLVLVATGLLVLSILFVIWQYFTNKNLSKLQKRIGVIAAGIPVLGLLGWLIFVAMVLLSGVH
jgi:hypothetical protein